MDGCRVCPGGPRETRQPPTTSTRRCLRAGRTVAARPPSRPRKEGGMTNPHPRRAAFYARVSSDKQAEEDTVASQVAALQERFRQDNVLVEDELSFIDDGY